MPIPQTIKQRIERVFLAQGVRRTVHDYGNPNGHYWRGEVLRLRDALIQTRTHVGFCLWLAGLELDIDTVTWYALAQLMEEQLEA